MGERGTIVATSDGGNTWMSVGLRRKSASGLILTGWRVPLVLLFWAIRSSKGETRDGTVRVYSHHEVGERRRNQAAAQQSADIQ